MHPDGIVMQVDHIFLEEFFYFESEPPNLMLFLFIGDKSLQGRFSWNFYN